MKPEHVSRYIRPSDIPLLDDTILQPLLQGVVDQMITAGTAESAEQWYGRLHAALRQGELVIVIDDRHRRLGLVRTDVPPYAALLQSAIQPAVADTDPVDPLGIRSWQRTADEEQEHD